MKQINNDDIQRIREWIISKHPKKVDIDLDTDLIENRLIDSLTFVDFLFVLEEVFGKSIDIHDLDFDQFKTLRTIQSYFLEQELA